METSFWNPLWLTLQLATITTVLLLLLGIPLAHWLAYSRFKFKAPVEALVSLPLVLPPSVLGFYLLIAFSPANGIGKWFDEHIGIRFVFTFSGLVIGSLIFSLPFMVNALLNAFRAVPISLREAAMTLGKTKVEILRYVILPFCKHGIITGIVMTFAHTIGEFGVVLMIGGAIPRETRLASVAVYEEVEALNFSSAHLYSIILLATSFILLTLMFTFNRKIKE